jgi:lipid II:glycine glycyltransferase (peptidoglycan interpeptide bridge formation enzyme)
MKIQLKQKETQEVFPTDIVFQTAFWSAVKSQLGWKSIAFDFSSPELQGDVLVLTKTSLSGISMAYVPQGPEFCPETDQYVPHFAIILAIQTVRNSLSSCLPRS